MGNDLLTREDCRRVFEAVERAGRRLGADGVEVLIDAHTHALTRFANNGIHQNVAERSVHLSVRAVIGQRTARASVNRLDAASLRRVVEEAVALTRAAAPDPALPPLYAPAAPVLEVVRYSVATAGSSPGDRARAVAEAIAIVEAEGQTAAGIYSAGESAEAILNSNGVEAFHRETMAVFSITAMDCDSSGWAKASAVDCGALDPAALARTAAAKARASRAPRAAPPGRYTVILEPAAVLDVVGQMFPDFGATPVAEQRSFLTGRVGQRLFGENITIRDDVFHPAQSGAPFDGEGVPRRSVTLVEHGVPAHLVYSRARAALDGAEPTGHGFPLPNEHGEMPLNIVIEGGGVSTGEMIAATGRGILVTRLWYIREVDPYQKIMTGMTRDGTFLIEDGAIRYGLRNLRFNQSLIEMLSNVEAMSPPARASGEESFDMVAPAMKVRGFNFTEVTTF